MSRKKGGVLCAAMLAITCVLGSCGVQNTVVSYAQPEEDVTTITFFGNKYEPENVTVIEEIISDFMREHPEIRVSYESLKGAEYYEALSKRMAAGKGDDVFMVNHDAVLALSAAGQLADLSALDTIPSYTEAMRGQMQENGGIFWVPTTVSVFGLYCNLDLLREHRLDVPTNLGEWQAVCDEFVEQGVTPIIANNDISLKTLAIGRSFYALYQENRQQETFARLNSGEARLSESLREGFTLAEAFLRKGYIDADKALETQKTSDDLTEFIRGESPFMLTGAWAAGRVEGMEPDFAFEVVPLPLLEDGALLVINADTRLSVNADSGHKEEALQFVQYFTRADNINKFANQQSSFSPLKQGEPSYVREIAPLIACYQAGQTVIGTDSMLELPIWNLTAEVSKKLLAGEPLDAALAWMDAETGKKRGATG